MAKKYGSGRISKEEQIEEGTREALDGEIRRFLRDNLSISIASNPGAYGAKHRITVALKLTTNGETAILSQDYITLDD